MITPIKNQGEITHRLPKIPFTTPAFVPHIVKIWLIDDLYKILLLQPGCVSDCCLYCTQPLVLTLISHLAWMQGTWQSAQYKSTKSKVIIKSLKYSHHSS